MNIMKTSTKTQYQKRQREYSLLGTSVVFEAYLNKQTTDYFSYRFNPLYVLVDNGILFHYTVEDDLVNICINWLKKYKSIDTLLQHKKKHDYILRSYRHFTFRKPAGDTITLLKRLPT